MDKVKALFDLVNHNLATTNGTMDYGRITDSIISLSNTLANTDTGEDVWYLGEFGEFCLSDLIVGAYWHYTEWHGGQWSKGYAALSALGKVFSPSMTSIESERENGSSAVIAYDMLNHMAEEYFDQLRGKSYS